MTGWMNPLMPMNRISHRKYFCYSFETCLWGKLSVKFEINWSNFLFSLFVCNESNDGATMQGIKITFQSLNLALKGRCSNIHNSWLFRCLNAFYQFSHLFLAKLAKRVSIIFSANFTCDTKNRKIFTWRGRFARSMWCPTRIQIPQRNSLIRYLNSTLFERSWATRLKGAFMEYAMKYDFGI